LIQRALARGRRAIRDHRARRLGLIRVAPNYGFLADFAPCDAAIDIGVGDDPDLSIHLIERYGIECFAVDPTRKHAQTLQAVERRTPSFHYLPYALGPENRTVEFHESKINVSGSLLKGHGNVVNDPCVRYEVEMVTLERLLDATGRRSINLLKMDTEGAEYATIDSLGGRELRRIRQVMVEFHHDRIEGITWSDTQRAIRTMRRHGMKSLLYNGRDCLFYW
jgi:FkbM family methyltransferase